MPTFMPDQYSRDEAVRDVLTLPFAEELANEMERVSGRRPHIVVMHLHRVKLDANRAKRRLLQGRRGNLARLAI